MKVLLVYNPYSSRNKEKRLNKIYNLLSIHFDDITIYKSIYKNSITDYLIKYSDEFDLLIILGGDGTIHEVICALENVNKPPLLFVFPSGGCNDISKSLGLSKNINRNIKVLLKNNIREVPSFRINNSYFLYAMAIGMMSDASYNTSYRLKYHFKRLAYYIYCLKAFFKAKPTRLNINDKAYDKLMLLLLLHTKSLAGYKIKNGSIFDENLVLVGFNGNKLISLFRFILFLFFNRTKNLLLLENNNFKIELFDSTTINVDGERLDTNNEIDISISKNFSFISKN